MIKFYSSSFNSRPITLLWFTIISLWCFTSSTAAAAAAASSRNKNTTTAVHYFKWSVEYMYWSPDWEERVIMGINGQFPGPTIRARAGDIVHVDLTNKLPTEGVVIHWHGIRQLGTPWADGTAAISQCPIDPGETFTYRFEVDKPGTYFYHGHDGMQGSAGLYGSLIVDVAQGQNEPFHYDGEFYLLLSDWWHQSSQEQTLGLSSKPFRWVGEPQSLPVNGRGQYNCSLAPSFANSSLPVCNFNGSEQWAPPILHVLPNKTYRIRLASTTSLASLNLAIGGHKMLVVEADGNNIEPFETDDLDIYSGQTYSVLITTNQDPNTNYWVRFGVIARKPNTAPALTVLSYQGAAAAANIPTVLDLPTASPPTVPLWNNYTRSKSFTKKIFALMGSSTPPKYHSRRIVLLNTQNKYDGYTKWAINNVSLALPATPYLGSIKFGLKNAFDQNPPPDNFPSDYDIMNPPPNPNTTLGNGVYQFKLKTVVDVILQNANALNPNASETHPWHLHGHDFWVLGYGEGKFKNGDEKKFNLKNPPLRNTNVVFPYGWTALRFITDNPGVWAFHCHIEPHLVMGMGLVFAEGVNYIKGIPSEALACGLTAKMFLKKKYLG